jgi:hypothetical protein
MPPIFNTTIFKFLNDASAIKKSTMQPLRLCWLNFSPANGCAMKFANSNKYTAAPIDYIHYHAEAIHVLMSYTKPE